MIYKKIEAGRYQAKEKNFTVEINNDGGGKYWMYPWNLHVWCERDGETEDLVGTCAHGYPTLRAAKAGAEIIIQDYL